MKKFFYTLIGIIVSSVLSAADFDDQVGDNQTGTPPINIIKIDPNIPFNPHYINDDRFADTSGYTYTPEPLDDGLVNLVIQQAPQDLNDLIQDIKNNRLHLVPKTILLLGKPGTGKTTLPQAIAQQCNVPYTLIECPLLANEYKNSGGQNLSRALERCFKKEKFNIVLLDEIGSILKSYKEQGTNFDSSQSFLALMNRMEQSANLIVFATANETTDFPEAAKRRFKKEFKFSLPDASAREGIMKYYLQQYNISCQDALTQYIAQKTKGFSARELSNLAQELACYITRSDTTENNVITTKVIDNVIADMLESSSLSHLGESYSSRTLSWIKDNHTIVLGVSTGIIVPAVIFYLGWRLNQAQQKMIEAHQQEAFELQQKSMAMQQAHQQEAFELQKKHQQELSSKQTTQFWTSTAISALFSLLSIWAANRNGNGSNGNNNFPKQ